MSLVKELSELSVVIVTHTFATGPAQELAIHLRNKVRRLVFIGHPFSFSRDTRSSWQEYWYGKLTDDKKKGSWKLPQLIMYARDVIYTLMWILFTKGKFDLYIGADNLNATVGIILRRLGKVKRVIFYTIDYVPCRFKNPFLNYAYHWLDRFCLLHCDCVWNLSPLMAEGRAKRGIKKDSIAPQLVVPNGVAFSTVNRPPRIEINRHHMVFLGHLRENQGLELIIHALADIAIKVPNVKLFIIGTGPLEAHLKEITIECGVTERVFFNGYIENHTEIDKLMASCAIGLAPYEPNPQSFTYYTDPAKPKRYMVCGLPVIITRVAWIADAIEKKPMGIVINYAREELVAAMLRLLGDDPFYDLCRQNAIQFASTLEWSKIFEEALQKSVPIRVA